MADKPPPQQAYPPAPQQAYPPPQQPVGPPPAYPQQPGYSPYPQQPGYPVAQAGHTTTIIQQPTVIAAVPMYRETPIQMACPYCHATIVTSTSYEPGTLAWLACLGLAFVGCWIGCCLIPFCIDGCKDCAHHCPNCQRQLGVYRRM